MTEDEEALRQALRIWLPIVVALWLAALLDLGTMVSTPSTSSTTPRIRTSGRWRRTTRAKPAWAR